MDPGSTTPPLPLPRGKDRMERRKNRTFRRLRPRVSLRSVSEPCSQQSSKWRGGGSGGGEGGRRSLPTLPGRARPPVGWGARTRSLYLCRVRAFPSGQNVLGRISSLHPDPCPSKGSSAIPSQPHSFLFFLFTMRSQRWQLRGGEGARRGDRCGGYCRWQ